MESFLEILKIIGPAALVLYAMYLMVRSFLVSRMDELNALYRKDGYKEVVTIRLQAYERITLLLERITPSNMVSRINHTEFTAKEYQSILINEIRQEFNHNLSQQIYMSEDAWSYVKGAVEETISLINEISSGLDKEAKGMDLAMKIIERSGSREIDNIYSALNFLKNEIKEVF